MHWFCGLFLAHFPVQISLTAQSSVGGFLAGLRLPFNFCSVILFIYPFRVFILFIKIAVGRHRRAQPCKLSFSSGLKIVLASFWEEFLYFFLARANVYPFFAVFFPGSINISQSGYRGAVFLTVSFVPRIVCVIHNRVWDVSELYWPQRTTASNRRKQPACGCKHFCQLLFDM